LETGTTARRAMSSSSDLASIEKRWLELYGEMRSCPSLKSQIAGLFLSVPPVTSPSILYVGKATDKDWYLRKFLRYRTIEERHECTSSFLREGADVGQFWHFARNLSEGVARATGQVIQPFQNLAWTNVCKIGVVQGNPRKDIRLRQRKLAVETLSAEIGAYRPALIVFVTGDFEAEIIDQVADDPERKSWHKRDSKWYWWRESVGKMPPVLWTYHPQGKGRDLLKVWLDRALRIIGANN
jgi:hypothetical protein